MLGTAFTCPECGSVLQTAQPTPKGKKIKCSKCGVIFVTSEDNARPSAPPKRERPDGLTIQPRERPRRDPREKRARKDEDDEVETRRGRRTRPRPDKAEGNWLVMTIVAGGFLFLLLAGCLVAGLFWLIPFDRGSSDQPAEPVVASAPVIGPAAPLPGNDGDVMPPAAPDRVEHAPLPVPEVPVAAGAGDAIPIKMLEAIKAATVFIKVEAGALAFSGSGFLMKADGDIGYVVTNHHVVTPPVEEVGPQRFPRPFFPPRMMIPAAPVKPVITVVFGSGTSKEQSVPAEVLASEEEVDLAVLKVSGVKDLPRPIDLGQQPQLVETMPLYIFGFPFGTSLAVGKGNPAITINKGAVSSIRLNDRGELARVQIDGDLNPGNSGGPVVDVQGRLIGISVAKIRDSRIGLAIPSVELAQLLHGRMVANALVRVMGGNPTSQVQGEVWFLDHLNKIQSTRTFTLQVASSTLPPERGQAGGTTILAEGRLMDPLNKIQEVKVYFLRGDATKNQPQVNPEGVWPVLPDAKKADLKIEGQTAKAALDLGAADQGDDVFTFQFSYVSGEGQTVFTQPRTFHTRLLAATPPNVPVAGPPIPPPKEEPPKPLTDAELTQALADLKSTDIFRRRTALDRLAKAEPGKRRDEVMTALEGLRTDSNFAVRTSSVKGLALWGKKDSVPALLEFLKDDTFSVRWAVMEELGKLQDGRAAEPVAGQLPVSSDRTAAGNALKAMGPVAEKSVVKYLTNSDWGLRLEVVNILAVIGTKESIPALETAAKDSNGLVSWKAKEALAKIGAGK